MRRTVELVVTLCTKAQMQPCVPGDHRPDCRLHELDLYSTAQLNQKGFVKRSRSGIPHL